MNLRFSFKKIVVVSILVVGGVDGFFAVREGKLSDTSSVKTISSTLLSTSHIFVPVDNPDYVLPGRLTSAAKVRAVLRKNHRVVKGVAEERFKGDTVFIGYLLPKGYSDRDKCARRRFGISVGDYILTEREFGRLVGEFDSGSRYGNVRIEYVRNRCDLSSTVGSAQAELEMFLADEILRLMPGIPPGP